MQIKRTRRVLSILAAIVATSLAAFTPLAHAGESSWYLGFELGKSDLDTWPAKVDFGSGIKIDGSMDLDASGHAGLLLGKQSGDARFELEYQYGRFNLARLELGPLTEQAGGAGHYSALTLNAYRRVELSGNLSGFGGAGVGWGSVSMPQAGFSGGCHCFPHASDRDWVYQARLGMEYLFGESNFAFAQYTWLRLPSAAQDSSINGPGIEYPRRTLGILSIGYRRGF
ncbi:MAG: outer membrane beta-barrel protein [Proteobacteria bacterium]|nr:outer membrane beta-barrel protein [Pseudomonadota bacterium]